MAGEIRVIPVRGIGEVRPHDDLAATILGALAEQDLALADRDVLVVTQKIVSKAEGRIVDPSQFEPSHMAEMAAAQGKKAAHYYEVVLRESRRIVKMDRGVLVTETHHGLICANAGVDESNVAGGQVVTLLPVDPDRSATVLRASIFERTNVDVAVIISDTFGRPWREGQVDVALGVAGVGALLDWRGRTDMTGRDLLHTVLAVADQLAAAAGLLMEKDSGVAAVLVRGFDWRATTGRGRDLVRPRATDLFR